MFKEIPDEQANKNKQQGFHYLIINLMSTKNGNTLTYRVTQLEKQYCDLDSKISLILENHLPHITQELSEIRPTIKLYTAMNIGALIVALLVHELL